MADDLARLVASCLSGDEDGWREMLSRYGKLIYSVAQRLGADHLEAEEVFQRTWVVVVERLHTLKEPERLVSWLVGIARYQTWRMFAEHRTGKGSLPVEEARFLEAPDDPQEELLEEERASLANRALELLDERCRKLLKELFFGSWSSYQELGERLGMPVGSIGPTRGRCLKKLKRIVEELQKRGIRGEGRQT